MTTALLTVILAGFVYQAAASPLPLRRLITMAPPLAALAAGVDPTQALLLSQVVLSFGIPLALLPLLVLVLASRRSVMGVFVNRPATTVTAGVITALISGLNLLLAGQVLLG